MSPQDPVFIGDESFRKIKIAEDQSEFQTLPAVMSRDSGAVTVRYKLTPQELSDLNAGFDLFMTVLTMGKKLQPIMPFVDDMKNPVVAKAICEDWRQFVG